MWLQVIADLSVGVSNPLAKARDWIDYVTLVVAVLAALGTVGAVLVALFGPAWQARSRRPSLYVESRPRAMSQSRARGKAGDDSPATEFTFELGNAAGRDTARDVEIFLSSARAVTEVTAIGGLERIPLAAGLSVPPNFRRPVTLLLLGTDTMIRQVLGAVDDGRQGVTSHHTVAFAATSPWGPQWLDPDSYDVSLFVTGSNFDAVRFDGAVMVTRVDQAHNRVSTGLRWEDELRPVAMDAPRRRRSPTHDELQQRIKQDQAHQRGRVP